MSSVSAAVAANSSLKAYDTAMKVQNSVLNKAMDNQKSMATQLLDSVSSSALPANVGKNINVTA